MPNFDEISQSTPEIKLLPVLENGQPPYWNCISGFDFYVCAVISMSFYMGLPNFVLIGRSWRSDDVISHFHDGGHTVGNVLPGSDLVTASV